MPWDRAYGIGNAFYIGRISPDGPILGGQGVLSTVSWSGPFHDGFLSHPRRRSSTSPSPTSTRAGTTIYVEEAPDVGQFLVNSLVVLNGIHQGVDFSFEVSNIGVDLGGGLRIQRESGSDRLFRHRNVAFSDIRGAFVFKD